MEIKINKDLYIRQLEELDVDVIVSKELEQGWHPTREKYLNRLKDAHEDYCYSFVAIFKDEIAGYINLYFKKKSGPLKDTDIPEIVDLGVFESFRNHGIGNALLDVVEKLAKPMSDYVYLGVGLHEGYGRAQRLYVKRGYVPDGQGAYYHDKKAKSYHKYPLDDDLVIYMTKAL